MLCTVFAVLGDAAIVVDIITVDIRDTDLENTALILVHLNDRSIWTVHRVVNERPENPAELLFRQKIHHPAAGVVHHESRTAGSVSHDCIFHEKTSFRLFFYISSVAQIFPKVVRILSAIFPPFSCHLSAGFMSCLSRFMNNVVVYIIL